MLFRGANHMVVNKQDQTALHVAHIISNHQVAEVIQCHNPSASGTGLFHLINMCVHRLQCHIVERRSIQQDEDYLRL